MLTFCNNLCGVITKKTIDLNCLTEHLFKGIHVLISFLLHTSTTFFFDAIEELNTTKAVMINLKVRIFGGYGSGEAIISMQGHFYRAVG